MDITKQSAEEFFNGSSFLESGTRHMESMVEHKAFYKYIVKKDGCHSYSNFYFEVMNDYVVTYLRKYKRHLLTEEDIFAIKLFWRGATAMMVEWIENDMKMQPHVLNSYPYMCMPPVLKKHYL